MPTTFTSLIMFALLVMPGVAYVTRRQREMPYQDRSVFRESVTVAVAGIAFNLAVLVPVLAAAAVWPHAVIDVGALIAEPRVYLAEQWVRAGLSATTILAAATGLALLASRKPSQLHPSDSSSWEVIFGEWRQDCAVSSSEPLQTYVGCDLDDGSWIGGYLGNYNPTTAENGDRDLLLVGPIRYRAKPDHGTETCEGIDAACIPARNIRTVHVAYNVIPETGSEGSSPESAQAAPSEEEGQVR